MTPTATASIYPAARKASSSSEHGRLPYCDEVEVLELELERALVFWKCRNGKHPSLKTQEDWSSAWRQWAKVLLPKFIATMPGRRPAAMYVLGIIPPRPVQGAIPAQLAARNIYVPSADGTGQTFYDLPEPYQRDELLHLIDLGIVDDDEIRRARKSPGSRADYVFEIARYR
jgi:hypothetical protein